MSIHIIIDGYNIIRQSSNLSVLDNQDLQMGREALLELLALYKKIKQHRITVVFDGKNAPAFAQPNSNIEGVDIKFSGNGETADTVIKQMAAIAREKALVVSSDREIIDFAAQHGSATISSPGFEAKVATAVYLENQELEIIDEDNNGWIPTTKKKGPQKKLSKKERQSRIKINKL